MSTTVHCDNCLTTLRDSEIRYTFKLGRTDTAAVIDWDLCATCASELYAFYHPTKPATFDIKIA